MGTCTYCKKNEILKNNKALPVSKVEEIFRKIAKGGTIPILGTILVEDGKAVATNLDITFEHNTSKEDGLYEIVDKKLVKSEEFAGMENDFPVFTPAEDFTKIIGMINRNELLDKLQKAKIFVISKAEIEFVKGYRAILDNILLYIQNGRSMLLATDGLKIYSSPLSIIDAQDWEYLISTKAIEGLKGLSGNIEIKVCPLPNGQIISFNSTEGGSLYGLKT